MGRFPGRHIDQRRLSMAGLVVAAILLVAVNAFSNGAFRGFRLDFTEGLVFTLSDGTRKVLGEIDEPITLRFFYSDQLGEVLPAYASHAARVRELIEQYVGLAGGRIHLEIHRPEPFSEEEDLAVSLGLQGLPVNQAGDLGYFGLVGTNSTDDEELIPFFQAERGRFLEYDLTKLVSALAKPEKKVVGLMTTLPMGGGAANPMLGPRAAAPSWMIVEQLRQRFELRQLSPQAKEIDDDIGVLMLVHPKSLDDQTLYAIDQFVLGGGRLLAFVDPHSEADRGGPISMMGGTSSDLSKLLDAWGVEVLADKIVGDRTAAIRVSTGTAGRRRVIEHLAWLSLGETHINRDDVVTAELERIILAAAGVIRKRADASTKVTPLLTSSREAMQIEANKLRIFPNFTSLIADYRPENEILVLAARVAGQVESAFPEGPPVKPKDPTAKKDEQKSAATGEAEKQETGAADAAAKHLGKSKEPIEVILVADTDMLQDQFWVQIQDFFGQRIAVPTSNNGDFVLNAIDNLSGSGALIGLRGRGQTARPFDLVRRIQLDAELRYRAKERELRNKLADTEKQLKDLQVADEAQGTVILSGDQVKAIKTFRAEMLVIRKEVREVQHALRRDIDRLDMWLKFVNIALIPVLVGLAAIVPGVVRRRRRQRTA